MAYLMEIGFDNSCRLARKRYMFQYRGVAFKLVQDNPRRWAECSTSAEMGVLRGRP
jgi:hypothetical protein